MVRGGLHPAALIPSPLWGGASLPKCYGLSCVRAHGLGGGAARAEVPLCANAQGQHLPEMADVLSWLERNTGAPATKCHSPFTRARGLGVPRASPTAPLIAPAVRLGVGRRAGRWGGAGAGGGRGRRQRRRARRGDGNGAARRRLGVARSTLLLQGAKGSKRCVQTSSTYLEGLGASRFRSAPNTARSPLLRPCLPRSACS
jgi:hypothetical protein